jgi:hypothetical protein
MFMPYCWVNIRGLAGKMADGIKTGVYKMMGG